MHRLSYKLSRNRQTVAYFVGGKAFVSLQQVYEKFSTLVKTNFIQRCAPLLATEGTETAVLPLFKNDEAKLYELPSIEAIKGTRKVIFCNLYKTKFVTQCNVLLHFENCVKLHNNTIYFYFEKV